MTRPVALTAVLAESTLLPPPTDVRTRRRRQSSFGSGWPPDSWDGEGGGGGGGGDDEPEDDPDPLGAARFAFAFFLAGIGTLFFAFLVAYIVLRRGAEEWPPPGAPIPPDGLWISTLVLVASDVCMNRAVRRARRGDRVGYRSWLELTGALGVVFVAAQLWLWRELLGQGLTTDTNAYGTIFYSLTGLHVFHVLGGLAYIAWAIFTTRLQPIRRIAAPGSRVGFCAMYWHFMGALWIILFAVLYLWS